MREYITLMGAEDVERAGHNMADAADTMRNAAMSIEDSLQRFMDRFEAAIEHMDADLDKAKS